jgi:Protein phosphatase 2C
MSRGVDERFGIAAGTVLGTEHVALGRVNQDAHAFRAEGENLVAVVCDGCGSGARSEVGAALGARLVVEQLLRELGRGGALDAPGTLERVRREVIALLGGMVRALGGRAEDTVADFFLFTVVGLAVAGNTAWVFSAGDGLIVIGDEILELGPFPRNEPPYLGYGLLDPPPGGTAPGFVVHRVVPAGELRSVLLGTDGALDLMDLTATELPGGGGEVGPLRQFWEDDRYFENPDMLRRRLARINQRVSRPVWEERRLERETGLLRDDTTLLVVRPARGSAGARPA